jgi:hypothetical protein
MAASAKAAKLNEGVGQYSGFANGVVAMSSGAATVKLPMFAVIEGVVAMVVNAATGVGETVQVVDIDNTNGDFDIETVNEAGSVAGSSLVAWIAWGKPKA